MPRVVEVERIVEKIVVVPRIIEKIVEVPKIIEKIVVVELQRANFLWVSLKHCTTRHLVSEPQHLLSSFITSLQLRLMPSLMVSTNQVLL